MHAPGFALERARCNLRAECFEVVSRVIDGTMRARSGASNPTGAIGDQLVGEGSSGKEHVQLALASIHFQAACLKLTNVDDDVGASVERRVAYCAGNPSKSASCVRWGW
jgi:hypothetical protein